MQWIRKRLPAADEIWTFYATVVFVVYGWTSLQFLWKLSSWFYFLTLGEITGLIAYALVSDFLESLVVLAAGLAFALVLPPRLMRISFSAWGAILVYSLTLWAAFFDFVLIWKEPAVTDPLALLALWAVAAATGILLAARHPVIERGLTAFGERLKIFLYVWIPLSCAALPFVLGRLLV
jgi:hypothetical protein